MFAANALERCMAVGALIEASTSCPALHERACALWLIDDCRFSRDLMSLMRLQETVAGALTSEELSEKIRDVHVLGIRSKMQVWGLGDGHARAVHCSCSTLAWHLLPLC